MLLILTPYQNKHEEKKINKYVLKFRGRDWNVDSKLKKYLITILTKPKNKYK
jgi:uncharacterized protein YfbU (UPF0304 family)